MTSSSEETDRTLAFLVAIDDTAVSGGDKGLFGGRQEPTVQRIGIAQLRANLEETLEGLADLFRRIEHTPVGLPIKEVQVAFEITATGKVALLGTGAEVAGKGAITLTLGR
jgi:hypothetical protein